MGHSLPNAGRDSAGCPRIGQGCSTKPCRSLFKPSVPTGWAGMSPSPPGRSAEGAELSFRRLPANGRCGLGDIGFPVLARDVAEDLDGSGSAGELGESLQAHIGGEFAGALRLALEAGDAVQILVAVVIGELAGEVARGRDFLGVEFTGANSRADQRADDAFQMHFHRALVQ